MRVLRVAIKSWTSTFRYPTFQSGYQPTLPLPPISTILGLLSAAKGDIVTLKDVGFLGFIFFSKGKGVDIEKTYYLGEKTVTTDIIKREVLIDNTLYLYLPEEWNEYLKKPMYQLLLGRSCDLATVYELKNVELDEKDNVKIKNTLVPLDLPNAVGVVHALPVEFDYTTIPRKPKVVRPFILATQEFTYQDKTFYDQELNLGVWMYGDKDFS